MKHIQLNKEEQALLDAYERGDLQPVANAEEQLKRYQAYAKEMSKKSRSINLRITDTDLMQLKARASESGVPYQTLVGTLIRKFNQRKISVEL